jgi:hypothetical protein
MGFLVYNGGSEFSFADRTLAHLKIAIAAKLRLKEGFLLSWRIPPEDGGGRVSLWLSPSIPLEFIFTEPTPPPLNRRWLEALARSSHGPRGMVVLDEEDAEALTAGEASDVETQKRIQKALDEIG